MKTIDILAKMHEESRADSATLVKKVDEGFASINASLISHTREDDQRFSALDLKLQPLVEMKKSFGWAKRTLYASAAIAVLTEVAHIVLTRAK